ncbi:MAG: YfhO family protein [Acidobacteriota bacterium]|nr:YfhO family protein [Acidobacteriota bacterium]
MAFLLYAATAALLLWLTHRFVLPVSWAAALVLFALPPGLVGKALITDGVYGPIDYVYQDAPFKALDPGYASAPPRNASATDVFSEFFPWRRAVQASLRRGEWPLWNAYNLCGHPLAAEAQAAPYSPFTLLACLLPAAVSMSYSAAMAMFIAALSAFLLARELECSEAAALVAAIGWGLASSIVLYSHTAMGFATAYLPLILFATRRIVRRPGLASASLLTTALALCLLAGHPESLFLNVLIGCAYALFELTRNRIAPWRPIVAALGSGIVAIALSAIFLLPLLEAFPQSAELSIKSGQAVNSRGATTERVLAALARDLFPYLHVRNWISPSIGHVGAETAAAGSIVLALAFYAIWRRRSAETWFFAALGFICIAAGARWGPVADALQKLPLLHITHHDRLAFAGALSLVLLAALGFEEILRRHDRRAAAITLAVVFGILSSGTFWLTQRVELESVAGGYGKYKIFAELFFLGAAALLLSMPAHRRVLIAGLLGLLAAQRFLSELDTFSTYPAEAAWPKLALFEPLDRVREPFRIVGQGTAFPPASNTFYGLEDVRGYEALTFNRFYEMYRAWSHRYGSWYNRVDDLTNPFLSFMNVRYAIQPDASPVPPGWRVVESRYGATLLENERVIERLFIPERVVVGDTIHDAIIANMSDVRDLRTVAWISAPGLPYERPNGPGRIDLRGRSLGGEYLFDADMQNDGWVVLSDTAWKGWRAYVDGRRVKMTRANAAFLSVYLTAGRHSVRVSYRPMSFVRGRAITFVTLLMILILAVWRNRSNGLKARRSG